MLWPTWSSFDRVLLLTVSSQIFHSSFTCLQDVHVIPKHIEHVSVNLRGKPLPWRDCRINFSYILYKFFKISFYKVLLVEFLLLQLILFWKILLCVQARKERYRLINLLLLINAGRLEYSNKGAGGQSKLQSYFCWIQWRFNWCSLQFLDNTHGDNR